MKNNNNQLIILWVFLITLAVSILYFYSVFVGSPVKKLKDKIPLPQSQKTTYANAIKVTSPAFNNGSDIPIKYTCQGTNINPPLNIANVPNNTQSLLIIVEDPDALIKVWTHWIAFNINPKTSSVNENEIPSGALAGQNDFGKGVYSGPCPPSGKHSYIFKVYALDKKLKLGNGATKQQVESEIKGHILDIGTLTGTFGK